MTNLSDILPPSNVVTDTSTDTLTNKTLTSPKVNEDVAVTSTATELNILDGVTSTTAELNILDGVTSTAAELNILDGVTSTAAELNILDGVTSTAAELNILDGVTSTAAELNLLDGVSATTAEINYLDGVTSSIQTQLGNVGGGAWVVLSTVTASNSATVDVETTLDGTYDDYVVMISGVRPATDGAFLQLRTKVGGSYPSGNNYKGSQATMSNDSASISVEKDETNNILLARGVGNASNECVRMQVHISKPSSTGLQKPIYGMGAGVRGDGVSMMYFCNGMYYSAATAVTGLRFFFNSGNISVGTFRLYGVAKS